MSLIEKVLVLDDNEANLLFFEVLFTQLTGKYQIFTATTGPQAEAIVKAQRVGFIVSAWEMHPMPGTIFIQRIKKDRLNRNLPCLIFSKRMSDEDIVLAKDLGITNIVKMPFVKEQVSKVIKDMIAQEENLAPIEKKLRKIEYYSSEGQFKEALANFNDGLLQKSKDGRAYALAGEVWLGLRNFEKAEAYLKKALEISPDNFNASRLLARVYSLMGKHQEAIALLEQKVQESPKSLRNLLSLGSALVTADQYDRAREVFDRVEAIDAEYGPLQDERATLAFKEGNIPLAAQLLAETTQGDDLARSFNDMGIAQTSAKQYEKGVQLYKNAIQLLQNKAKLHYLKYNLGLAFYKMGDLVNSFRFFCESYLEEPSYEKAYSSLAKVSKELKQAGKSIDPALVKKVKEVRVNFKVAEAEKPTEAASDSDDKVA